MRIFLGSTSKHKLTAITEAASEVFPDEHDLVVQTFQVSSDINEQPVGLEETLQGARNRLKNLKTIIGDARYDLLVAMENGIFPVYVDGKELWFDLGWVVLEDPTGFPIYTNSSGIQVNTEYVEIARSRGFSTTTVGSISAERSAAERTDPNAFLTAGHVTRTNMLKQACKVALGQLLRHRADAQ